LYNFERVDSSGFETMKDLKEKKVKSLLSMFQSQQYFFFKEQIEVSKG